MAAKKTSKKQKTGASPSKGARAHDRDAEEPGEPPPFPVVGLGASAGGLQPLEEFFSHMPAGSGMAFVVITHLHRGQSTLLPELLGRKTSMPVAEVDEATEVKPDHVYTVRPGYNLALVNGFLHAREPDDDRPHFPIDSFFRSLARERNERAIAIVLSGTGSDGTLGLKEIKAHMGLVVVQQEVSATHPGMPHSAIATGIVDYVLPVSQMPEHLLAYVHDMPRVSRSAVGSQEAALPEDGLHQVFTLLRARTGHDFSEYKSSTISRRIERRMAVHHVGDLEHYVRYLQDHPAELDILFQELLIGVTSFFRDPESFEALAKVLSERLAAVPEDYVFRAWVPGCSTGEEGYSIAILLRECMDRLQRLIEVQIFATDLDPVAIEQARAGVYPLGIAEDVSPGRLERFFAYEKDSFRVKKEIRQMLVFAPQSLTEDPPFTKVDLLSCRNLLIYLEGSVQKRLFPIFHYALRPGGILFLGSSESIGGFGNLFAPIDKNWKIFRRKDVAEGSYVTEFPAGASGRSATTGGHGGGGGATGALGRGASKVLLNELVPPAVIADEHGDIVHIHGRTGLFLEPAPGPQPTANVFNMARQGLQLELGAAMRQAAGQDGEVVRRVVRVRTNGDAVTVELTVRRLRQPELFRGLFLITFEKPAAVTDGAREGAEELMPPGRLAELERELRHSRQNHQSTVEDLETSNEELKSTNEELQSTNEELQSANEELETSKEEMQSLNEELQTVNAELQSKVDELSRTNDDMKNLLDSTDIATIFLDDELHILRFTVQASKVIRLIQSDAGRAIGDLVPRIRYERLVADAQEVLDTLVSKEVEVRGEDGTWYFMRILPYRTTENVIDGLVITFVDITRIRSLQESERLLLQALVNSPTTVFGQDRELRYRWVYNTAFELTAAELDGKMDSDLFETDEAERLTELKRQVLDTGLGARQKITLTVKGRQRRFDLYLEPMRAEGGDIIGVTGVATNIT